MDGATKGIDTLLGNPKKAILAMSIPMIVAMLAQSINNLIDAVWVAGLGPDALAAVGFIFPLFFILVGFSNGIGIGASSAIARHIGRGDKRAVDSTASQAVTISIAISIALTIFMLIFQRDLLTIMGSGDTLELCVDYGTPIYISTIILSLNGLLSNLLRSEGAARRSMLTQILAAAVNIILDPFFIYDFGLGMGMAGAAWATVISFLTSLAVMSYWYFVKKDTFVKISIADMRPDSITAKDILCVGIPASMEMIMISLFSIVINLIIVMGDRGTDGLAIFSSTWRIIQMLMIPTMAFGSAAVPVFGAAYGAKRFDKIWEAYKYSLKICTAIMLVMVAVTIVFAEQMVMIFTYSDSVSHLKSDFVSCLRILCLFLPFMSWGFVGAGLFQSIGLGLYSFICSVIRNGLQIPASWFLLISVGTTISMTWGITSMEALGSVIGGLWSFILLTSLTKNGKTISKSA